MATAPSPQQPVTADDVLTMQFTLIKKGGYDSQEVDAFLDRVAATMDRHQAQLPESAMTADDVRSVEFTLVKRGGYATREVDDFLDRVVAVLSGVDTEAVVPEPEAFAPDVFADLDLDLEPTSPSNEPDMSLDMAPADGEEIFEPAPAAAPGPEPAPEAPEPAQEAVSAAASVPVASAGAGPQLHDPEGAAQRLLAAAQQAADMLTADAKTYAETAHREADDYAQRVRSEADDYAQATRSEADEHAERVTTTAETQAASIREVAADEARRVAEEARSQLVDEMSELETRKAQLENTVGELEKLVSDERGRLLRILDNLHHRVSEDLPEAPDTASREPGHAASGAAMDPEPTDESVGEEAGPSDEPALDDAVFATGTDDAEAAGAEVDLDATAALDMSDVSLEVGADLPSDDLADDEVPSDELGDDDAEEAIVTASRSVFDLADDDDVDDDTSADWLDEEVAVETQAEEAVVETPHADDAGADDAPGGLFDIEAEEDRAPDASAADDPVPSGDSFFDELRQADDDDGLGPLDDDTDAALSAFFEAEEEGSNGKWRDRFGPGRG